MTEAEPIVYLLDASEVELRGRMSQFRTAGLNSRWELKATTSRNQLLIWLTGDAESRPRRQSVALIDLRRIPGDLAQSGFRVCETIRRHEYLWKATRPLIWADNLTESNCSCAEGVGADAFIDDAWVDEGDGLPLVEVIEWARGERPRPVGRRRGEMRCFPEPPDDLGRVERELADERFERWFGYRPSEHTFTMLWGMAGSIELGFLRGWCEAQGLASDRQLQRALEELQGPMKARREELDRAETSNAELARRFLAEELPEAPDPLFELAWPPIGLLRDELSSRGKALELAYLEPGGEELLDRFVRALGSASAGPTARHAEIEAALAKLAVESGRGANEIRAVVHRSAHSLAESAEDLRRCGEPVR